MTHTPQKYRTFEIWSYRPSHRQLLLRSNKDEHHATRVEILFRGVSLLTIPTVLPHLEITIVEPSDVDLTGVEADDKTVFRISASNFKGVIVADTMQVHEDEADYFEKSAILDTTGDLGV
jgi:hypothetical protein